MELFSGGIDRVWYPSGEAGRIVVPVCNDRNFRIWTLTSLRISI